MTVGELRRMLDRYPADDTPVIFMPQEFCSMGYPIWQDCFCTEDGVGDVNAVTIMLKDEAE